MLSRITIRTKLLVILALVAISSAGVTALLGYVEAHRALEEASFNKLTAVRELKASQVEDYFQQIANQIVTLSEDPMIVSAMREFKAALNEFPSIVEIDGGIVENADLDLRLYYQNEFIPRLTKNLIGEPDYRTDLSNFWPESVQVQNLQYLYLAANPFGTGEKHLLDAAGDGSQYSKVHEKYHSIIRNYLQKFGYYDIFLIDDNSGRIVYTVFKEVDFGTSLMSGPYRDTNFARVFENARAAAHRADVRLVDFEPYDPSYAAFASFIASPIYDGGEQIGVLAFQMPVDRINDIMTSRGEWSSVGLGATGEAYIVADDLTLRNQPRVLIEDKQRHLDALEAAGVPRTRIDRIDSLDNAIGLQEVDTAASRAALVGETGRETVVDFRGEAVLAAFKPLEIQDVSWMVMSQMDVEEALAPATRLGNRTLMILLALAAGSLVIAFVFARTLTQPLRSLSEHAAALAAGDLDTEIDEKRADEIGELAKSFNAMRRSIKRMVDRQAAAIDALSTPLIPLHDNVVVMPLVGELDERRIERVRAALVDGMHAMGAKVAILDVTGVPALDEAAALGLVKAARAARLIGARVVITGLRPELAESVAELDLPLEGLMIERSLEHGIALAMSEVPARLRPGPTGR